MRYRARGRTIELLLRPTSTLLVSLAVCVAGCSEDTPAERQSRIERNSRIGNALIAMLLSGASGTVIGMFIVSQRVMKKEDRQRSTQRQAQAVARYNAHRHNIPERLHNCRFIASEDARRNGPAFQSGSASAHARGRTIELIERVRDDAMLIFEADPTQDTYLAESELERVLQSCQDCPAKNEGRQRFICMSLVGPQHVEVDLTFRQENDT